MMTDEARAAKAARIRELEIQISKAYEPVVGETALEHVARCGHAAALVAELRAVAGWRPYKYPVVETVGVNNG